MEILQHLLGACADNHSHIDLTDSIFMFGESTLMINVKYYSNGIFYLIKTYIK